MADEGDVKVVDCRTCPAHKYIVEDINNNRTKLDWILRTAITTLIVLCGGLGGVLYEHLISK
jgi:hypothetical protein